MSSKFGRQPAADLILQQGTYQEMAETLSVPFLPLRQSVLGYTRPRPEAISALCKHFKVKPEDLFTKEVLSFPYNPRMNPWRTK